MNTQGQSTKQGTRRNFDDRDSPLGITTQSAGRPSKRPIMEDIEASESSDEEEPIDEANVSIAEWMPIIMKKLNTMDKRMIRIETRVNRKLDATIERVEENSENLVVIDDKVNKLTEDFEVMRREVTDLQKESIGLKKRVVNNEQMAFKGELIMDGIPEELGENQINCAEKVTSEIQNFVGLQLLETSIQRCFRMGKLPQTPENAEAADPPRPRGILIKFSWLRDRDFIWENRRKFKDSGFFINEHFPREIQLRRNELRPILGLLKKSDKYRQKSSLVGDRLIINGEVFTVDNLEKFPDDIDITPIHTKTEDGVTYFFRKRSPLSNHHPAPFTLANKTYSCSEQYYYLEMARLCSDEKARKNIMANPDPAFQKNEAKKIRKKTKAWIEKETETMTEAVRAKVLQNQHVRDFLIQTDQTTIAECNARDSKWGIGKSLTDDTRSIRDEWGSNKLGEILMLIRLEVTQMV